MFLYGAKFRQNQELLFRNWKKSKIKTMSMTRSKND
uniref:Uncharacterized protein n=1 Tax=Romanomermis culicivorax TaxID=13658 RepID=A0A915ILS0_ROMCU